MNAAMRQGRVRRTIDCVIALAVLTVTLPFLIIAAIGIKLSSPGPILFRARRIARDRRRPIGEGVDARPGPERRRDGYRGREFTLFKFRTMRVDQCAGAPITADKDSRVFRFGAFLRATKIDELPQFVNVINGDMALVGPRPEAPEIVRSYYTPDDLLTLQVFPGITSPGSLYYYTHCEATLSEGDATRLYTEQVLPKKLAIDRVYLRRATLSSDLKIVLRTIAVITGRMLGRKRFPDPPEIAGIAQ